MPESKYKKEKILKGFRCFSIGLAIFWTIFLIYILISEHYTEYYRIHLSQVDASIPKVYMDDEGAERGKIGNEFLIKSKENSYLIYGIELSNVDESSLLKFRDEDAIKKLKSANTCSQVLEEIQDETGFLRGDDYRKYGETFLYSLLFLFGGRMVWQELSGIYYVLYKGRFKIYGDMHDRREVCSIRKTKRAYGIVYQMMLRGDLLSCRL